MLAGTKRRARPMDLGPAGSIDGSRETLRLAFVAALQHLPARAHVPAVRIARLTRGVGPRW